MWTKEAHQNNWWIYKTSSPTTDCFWSHLSSATQKKTWARSSHANHVHNIAQNINGVSAGPVQNPDTIFLVSWNVAPTPPTPGTKRCMPGTSLGPWGALTGVNSVSADPLQIPDAKFLLVRMCHPLHWHQGPKGVSQVHHGGLEEHLQG